MPQYYQMPAGSSKSVVSQPGSCPASTVHPLADHRYRPIHSFSDHRYPPIQPLADHRYPPIQPLADHRYPPIQPLADHRYPPIQPLADHRYQPIQPLADHRYPPIQPLSNYRHPAHESKSSSSFTRRQFFQRLQALEKSCDRRRQKFVHRNNSRRYIQMTEVHGQDKAVPGPSGMASKVPSVGKRLARGGLTSRPEKVWTEFCHLGYTQRSVNPTSKDKMTSTQRPEHETTEDLNTLQSCPPQQQTTPLTNNNLPSSRRSSRLPSITYDDHSTMSQTSHAQLYVPAILLPRIYTQVPRPLQYREFLTVGRPLDPVTEDQWEELKDCRYIRHAVFGGPRHGHI